MHKSLLTILLSFTITAAAASDWTWRHPYPQGNQLSSVTWTGSVFVAVGKLGTILTSLTGQEWKPCAIDTNLDFHAIYWTGKKLIALTYSGTIAVANDKGSDWTLITMKTEFFYPKFQMIAWNSDCIVFSGDGLVRATHDLSTYEIYRGIPAEYVYWNGRYFEAKSTFNNRWISVDGRNWTEDSTTASVVMDSCTAGAITPYHPICLNGKKTLVDFSLNHVTLTTEGIQHVQKFGDSTSTSLTELTFDGTTLWAAGYNYPSNDNCGFVASTSNGSSWTIDTIAHNEMLLSIASNGSSAVTIGHDGCIFYHVQDQTWKQASDFSHGVFREIVWNGSLFVTAGNRYFSDSTGYHYKDLLLASPDGTTWTASTLESTCLFTDIVWTGSTFVAVGDSIALSVDGHTWDIVAHVKLPPIRSIAWNGAKLVGFTNNNMAVSSDDGVRWDTLSTTIPPGMDDIVWTGTTFIATNSDTVYASGNGVSWARVMIPEFPSLMDLVWTGKEVMLVGSRGFVYTSPDGSNWSHVQIEGQPDLSQIIKAGDTYYAFSHAGIGEVHCYRSTDGKSWIASGTKCGREINGVAFNGSTIVAVGDNNTIVSYSTAPQKIAAPSPHQKTISGHEIRYDAAHASLQVRYFTTANTDAVVSMVDVHGRTIPLRWIGANSGMMMFACPHLGAGYYLVRVASGSEHATRGFVVSR